MNKKEQLRNTDLKYITVKTKHSKKECRLCRTQKRYLPDERNLGVLFLEYLNSRCKEQHPNTGDITFIIRSAWDRRYVLDKKTVHLDALLELF